MGIVAAIKESTAFQEWRMPFEARGDVRIVLEKLRQELVRLDPKKFPDLHARVLVACFKAYLLRTAPATDDCDVWKMQVAALRDQQDQLHQAIQKIQRLLVANPIVMSVAIAQGRQRNEIMPPLVGKRPEYAAKLAEVLEALSNGISPLLTDDRTRDCFTNRVTGSLEYPKAIHLKRSKPDTAINQLVFELALLFKHWTTFQTTDLSDVHEWREGGEPHYALVADFVNVTLDIHDHGFTDRKAMDRIRDLRSNHPGIRYVEWLPTIA